MGGPLRVFDRLVGLVAGVVLVVAGLAMIGWRTKLLDELPYDIPDRVTAPWVRPMTQQSWWPWLLGIGGLVLFVLGLIWFLRHFRRQRVGGLVLDGTDRSGRLSVNAGSAMSAASSLLASAPGVRSARGHIRRDRHELVVEFSAKVDADADLALVRTAADRVLGQTATVLGRDDLGYRMELSVARPGSSDDDDEDVARVR